MEEPAQVNAAPLEVASILTPPATEDADEWRRFSERAEEFTPEQARAIVQSVETILPRREICRNLFLASTLKIPRERAVDDLGAGRISRATRILRCTRSD